MASSMIMVLEARFMWRAKALKSWGADSPGTCSRPTTNPPIKTLADFVAYCNNPHHEGINIPTRDDTYFWTA
jgi:hypothetical protein